MVPMMRRWCDSEPTPSGPADETDLKTPCHGRPVLVVVVWGATVGDIWVDALRAAVVVVLAVVAVGGLRAIDRRDRGEPRGPHWRDPD